MVLEKHSISDVLEAISDSKSLEIFQSIAKGSVESDVLKQKEGISKKQFYMRTQKLMKAGLAKRVKGKFSLTNFGVVVYHAALIMDAGIRSFWKLKAIDSIEDSGQIVEQERIKLIQTILDGSTIENILVKQK
jgi:predicted transcriptional regulator